MLNYYIIAQMGCDALHWASKQGKQDVVETLLEEGADIHHCDKVREVIMHNLSPEYVLLLIFFRIVAPLYMQQLWVVMRTLSIVCSSMELRLQ